jgi:aspartate aminotransferase
VIFQISLSHCSGKWLNRTSSEKLYPYNAPSAQELNPEGIVAALESPTEEKDVVILHACAYKPTGNDPTQGQWKKLAEVVGHKKLFVL